MSEHDIAIWGLVASWFGAIGTVGALFWALVLFQREGRRRRREGADGLVSWVDHIGIMSSEDDGQTHEHDHVGIHLHNVGLRPIRRVFVTGEEQEDGMFFNIELDGTTKSAPLYPGERAAGSRDVRAGFDLAEATIVFTDGYGRTWRRSFAHADGTHDVEVKPLNAWRRWRLHRRLRVPSDT